MEGGSSRCYVAVYEVLRVDAQGLVAETLKSFAVLPCASPPTYQHQVAKYAPSGQHNHQVSLLPMEGSFLAVLCTVFCWCPELLINPASTESRCCYTAVASVCPPYQPSCTTHSLEMVCFGHEPASS